MVFYNLKLRRPGLSHLSIYLMNQAGRELSIDWMKLHIGTLRPYVMAWLICLSVPPSHHSCAEALTPGGAVVKNLPANGGDARNMASILGLGRSLEEGNGYPSQYSCLENPMDRGAWQATVHGVAKSRTRLSDQARTYSPISRGWVLPLIIRQLVSPCELNIFPIHCLYSISLLLPLTFTSLHTVP